MPLSPPPLNRLSRGAFGGSTQLIPEGRGWSGAEARFQRKELLRGCLPLPVSSVLHTSGRWTELLWVLLVTLAGFSQKRPFLHIRALHGALALLPGPPCSQPCPPACDSHACPVQPPGAFPRQAEGGGPQAGLRAHGGRPGHAEGSGALPLTFCPYSSRCGEKQRISVRG